MVKKQETGILHVNKFMFIIIILNMAIVDFYKMGNNYIQNKWVMF